MSQENMSKTLETLGYAQTLRKRAEAISKADASERPKPHVNQLAEELHPRRQDLIIESIIEETDVMRTFRLKSAKGGPVAYFRAGQYIPFYIEVEGSMLSRPYSISSSPKDALSGFYEVTIQKKVGGYVSNYVYENWKVGDKVTAGGPEGNFYYTRLRDSKNVIGVSGGSGVTPFRAMAKAIVDKTMDTNLTLFYGINTMADGIYVEEFKTLEKESNGKFKIIFVLAKEEKEGCEKGFITAEMLNKHCNVSESSVFICGPQGLYKHMYDQTEKLSLRKKFIRYELFGETTSPFELDGYPMTEVQEFDMIVHQNSVTYNIKAKSDESVTVALERAGIDAPSKCRSGECGYCRAYIIKGDVFIPEDTDGRRGRDKELGYMHPCCSYPLSNIEMVVPRR